MRTRTVSMIVVALILLAIALPTMAQQMDSKTSKQLLDEGYAAKRGDLSTTFACHYEVATKDPFSKNGGDASRSLGDYNLKAGKVAEAEGWYNRTKQCADGKIAAIGCQRLAGLAIKKHDIKDAIREFQAAKDRNPEIGPEMDFSTGKCYVNLAQVNPAQPQRSRNKDKAEFYFLRSGTDASFTEWLGIRLERIHDSKVPIVGVPIKDDCLKWMNDYEAFATRCEDPEAKATASLMAMEIQFDFLNNPSKVIELGREINADWRAHRKQAAWARLVWGGALQDQGRYKEAISMYQSIVDDFTDANNFDRNNVRGLASRLITICNGRMAKK